MGLLDILIGKYSLTPVIVNAEGIADVSQLTEAQASCCVFVKANTNDIIEIHCQNMGLPNDFFGDLRKNKKELKALTQLDLTGNAFSDLTFDFELPQLRFIDLSHNKIPLTVTINADLPALEAVFIVGAQLNKIEIKATLEALDVLNLKNNPLTKIRLNPKFWENERNLNLNVSDTTVNSDLLNRTKYNDDTKRQTALQSYFSHLTKDVKRVKLLFLGNTDIGKTSLLNHFMSGENGFTPLGGNSTHGMNVFDRVVVDANANIDVRVFDFGGQDFYHNTHYTFFSHDVLYILVWGKNQYVYYRGQTEREKTEREKNVIETTYPLDYWLGSVGYFSDNQESTKRVHLLHNKLVTSNDNTDQSHLVEINYPKLREKFNFIDKIQGSAQYILGVEGQNDKKQVQGVEVKKWLEDAIQNFAQERDDSNDIIEAITEIKEAFKNKVLVKRKVVLTKIKNKTLLQALHDELYCFDAQSDAHWQDNKEYAILKEWVVLDFSKFSRWIHFILDKEACKSGDGYFTFEDAKNRTSNESIDSNALEYLLAFMQYQKIIFKAGEQYIAPQYLKPRHASGDVPTGKEAFALHMFINAFDKPFVEYEFEHFYHTSLFNELVIKYKNQLVSSESSSDNKRKDYLLWQNEAIIYEREPRNDGQNSYIPYLYLQFDLGTILPIDKNPNIYKPLDAKTKKPSIRLRTFSHNKESISDGFLREVMAFIEGNLLGLSRTEIDQFIAVMNPPSKPLKQNEANGNDDANKNPSNEEVENENESRADAFENDHSILDLVNKKRKEKAGYVYERQMLDPSKENYVPFSALQQQLTAHQQDKKIITDLFTYNDQLYRKGDFNLFLEKPLAMKRIFFSYSKQDLAVVHKFIDHLTPLKREGLVDQFYCTGLEAGSDWSYEIQQQLETCDIICFMISPNFVKTEYIYEVELKKIAKRIEPLSNKPVCIIPIILSSCVWQGNTVLNFEKYNVLPYTAVAIDRLNNQNAMWTTIVECIKHAITKPEDFLGGSKGWLTTDIKRQFEDIISGKLIGADEVASRKLLESSKAQDMQLLAKAIVDALSTANNATAPPVQDDRE